MCSDTAHNVSEAVLEVLLPIVKDIKKDINSVKRELTSLNETVSNLSGDLEQHKKGVESTSDLMRGDLKSVKKKLKRIDETVSHLSGDLEQHKNQTAADLQTPSSKLVSVNASVTEELTSLETSLNAKLDNQTVSLLADLQSSINRSSEGLRYVENRLVNQLDDLDSKIVSVHNTLTRGDLSSELTSLNESMNRICDKMEEHEDHMTTEIMELEETLQQNLTCELKESLIPPICDGTGGWRRAVYLDMTNPTTHCPRGWNMTDYSKRTCGRANGRDRACDSVTFSVCGGEYSQVCGRIRAYSWGWSNGFYGSVGDHLVDQAYFDGVAIMHGSPRQHIWTFVAGAAENLTSSYLDGVCPCDLIRGSFQPRSLSFIGEDYFCEAGYVYPGRTIYNEIRQFHSNDVLWDGKNCHSSSTCCSLHNPPYFTKHLNTSTTDDIELRMCHALNKNNGNVAVELVEIYVK